MKGFRTYREKAIKLHGVTSVCCGFNFEKIYGEYVKGFIEDHHIIPISSLEGST